MPNHEQERLTESEYEELYSDALRILSYEYDSVGLPHRSNTGERICRIESLHANDRTVFLLAFGSEVADSIEQSKPPMISFHARPLRRIETSVVTHGTNCICIYADGDPRITARPTEVEYEHCRSEWTLRIE